ncbi:MAG: hypothetical protein KGI27_08880 [Thaumarchaeota archaeon]|nr:hypothetical protein [Nitrososphaerota archaeon]
MIDLLIGLLVAKWWTDRDEKRKKPQEFSGNIDCNGIPYGYVKDGETIRDLQ